jgi:polyisoprenoid-binding protein YceI
MSTRKKFSSLLMLGILICATSALAQQVVFQVDPMQSNVEFTLGDVLHTVHGSFKMRPSTVQMDPEAGTASGAFIVDATSGNSGSNGRDKKMHKEILESAKYPEIRFTLQSIHGAIPANGTAQVQLSGTLNLHGSDHPFTVTAPVQVTNGHASADVHFTVPYVQWGLKNPSTFILRVSDKVDMVVHAIGNVTTARKS